jgi:hypothetical protein
MRRIESDLGRRRSGELAMEEERTEKRLVSGRSGDRGRRAVIGGEKTALEGVRSRRWGWR